MRKKALKIFSWPERRRYHSQDGNTVIQQQERLQVNVKLIFAKLLTDEKRRVKKKFLVLS